VTVLVGFSPNLFKFVDDTTILLDGSASSLNETIDTLSTFTISSGLKVNFEKTKVVWIGKEKYSANSLKQNGNYLGISTILTCLAVSSM
jgi:hypothetical protein